MTLNELLENYLSLEEEDFHIILFMTGFGGNDGRIMVGFDGSMCELLESSETLDKFGNREVVDWFVRTVGAVEGSEDESLESSLVVIRGGVDIQLPTEI